MQTLYTRRLNVSLHNKSEGYETCFGIGDRMVAAAAVYLSEVYRQIVGCVVVVCGEECSRRSLTWSADSSVPLACKRRSGNYKDRLGFTL